MYVYTINVMKFNSGSLCSINTGFSLTGLTEQFETFSTFENFKPGSKPGPKPAPAKPAPAKQAPAKQAHLHIPAKPAHVHVPSKPAHFNPPHRHPHPPHRRPHSWPRGPNRPPPRWAPGVIVRDIPRVVEQRYVEVKNDYSPWLYVLIIVVVLMLTAMFLKRK